MGKAGTHVWTAPGLRGFSSWDGSGRLRSCVRPVCAAGQAAGHNALRGSGPNRKHAFNDAMTQTGSPDPSNDLVCITSSCPRQFLQTSSSYHDSGFTSLFSLQRNPLVLRCRRAGAVHSIKSGHRAETQPLPFSVELTLNARQRSQQCSHS